MLDNPIQLPPETQTWLNRLRSKCIYWFNKLPQLFPRIQNIHQHLANALESFNKRSTVEIAADLLDANESNVNTIQDCIIALRRIFLGTGQK